MTTYYSRVPTQMFKFPVFSLFFSMSDGKFFPVPICVIFDYYVHKIDLADLSNFNFFWEIFTANLEIYFTFRIREFTT